MPRPFTRHQALQNAAFLRQLRRTGNVRDAARTLGVHRATFTRRRSNHPAFAADWDAALAIAHATLNDSRAPEAKGKGEPQSRHQPDTTSAKATEPRQIRTVAGRLQLRRAQPCRLTRSAEQAFLFALSATANVRLSAAAAGFSHSAFYHRRKQSPAFAREMRLALQQGYDRVELALLESQTVVACGDDGWRHKDPPVLPAMTVDQAIQLLTLHQREARLQAEPPHIKRRRGETREAHSCRMTEMYLAAQDRAREAGLLAEAARAEKAARSPFEPRPPMLPALDQVTGWSKAGR